MEGYELQPAKSVALNSKAKPKKKSLNVKNYKLGAKTMPTIESAVHLGIIRTKLHIYVWSGFPLNRATSSAHAVQLVLMFPILIPIFADSSLASNGLM
jgi:hypothetical protein